MPTLVISNFNVVTACLGGFALVYGLCSFLLKEKVYISEPLPAMIFGLIFQKAGWVRPAQYGNVRDITMEFCRLALGIQLLLAGVQLPAKYVKTQFRSIFVLLVPVMSIMWVVSALIIYLCIPHLTYLHALIIGACITPTDPVLSNSIIKGKFARKYVTTGIRDIISAESGANDGFGYPFLFLALYIFQFQGTEIAKNWIVETICYEILLSVAYGIVVGYLGQILLHFAKEKNLIDEESFLVFGVALALFIIGTAGMIGTDDLLACFVAGNFFNWDGWFNEETADDSFQANIDMLLNLGVFLWIGAIMPWDQFNTPEVPAWRYAVMGICIMVFRRIPAVILFYRLTPAVTNFSEAIFTGFFGPIGVGALFYLHVAMNALDGLKTEENAVTVDWILRVIYPVVFFSVLCSIICHGTTVSLLMLGKNGHKKFFNKEPSIPKYNSELDLNIEELSSDSEGRKK